MCFANSTKRTLCAPTVANMIAESISSPNFTKTLRSKRQHQGIIGHFSSTKTKTKKRAEDNLKRQVTAADVKMCEMITELNLPLTTADFLTNISIGRELTTAVPRRLFS